jgi:hypothetical protein
MARVVAFDRAGLLTLGFPFVGGAADGVRGAGRIQEVAEQRPGPADRLDNAIGHRTRFDDYTGPRRLQCGRFAADVPVQSAYG